MPDTPDLLTTAVESAAESIADRLDYELRAAWRAGYDYLDVIHDPYTALHHPDDAFRIGMYVWPHSNPEQDWPPRYRVERYDLRTVTSEEMRAALEESDA